MMNKSSSDSAAQGAGGVLAGSFLNSQHIYCIYIYIFIFFIDAANYHSPLFGPNPYCLLIGYCLFIFAQKVYTQSMRGHTWKQMEVVIISALTISEGQI